jgi:hypothetical protein
VNRWSFALAYLLAAACYELLPARQNGGGLELVVHGAFALFGARPDSPGNLPGLVLQGAAPFVLLGAALWRARQLQRPVLLHLTALAMLASWLQPLVLSVARLGIGNLETGLILLLDGLDIALPIGLFGACLALSFAAPAAGAGRATIRPGGQG